MEAPLRDTLIKSAFRYQDALQAYAFGILRDWALAEDVVQDSFIVIMNQWDDFEPGTNLFGWIRQIVHHKAMEARRSRTRLIHASEEALLARIGAALDRYFDERSAEHLRLRREALEKCMAQLGARSIQLLSGFYARAQTCESLALRQGKTANAVRITLHRLRKQLQDCVHRRLPALEADR